MDGIVRSWYTQFWITLSPRETLTMPVRIPITITIEVPTAEELAGVAETGTKKKATKKTKTTKAPPAADKGDDAEPAADITLAAVKQAMLAHRERHEDDELTVSIMREVSGGAPNIAKAPKETWPALLEAFSA